MELTMQIPVAMVAVMMAGLGTMSMFAPKKMLGNFGLEPAGVQGYSTVRSVIGGLFLASLGLLVYGLHSGEAQWFLAVAALMSAIAAGRIVSLVTDGFDRSVVPPLVVELVIVAVLMVASW